MESKPRMKIVTVYGEKDIESERKWKEEERPDAIAYFKNIVNTTSGADKEGALNVYVALLEGLTVCEDTFPYSQIEPYSVRTKADSRVYFLGNVQGQTLSGEREARVIYANKADAEYVADGLEYISGEKWEIEKEHGETRVPNYEKLLADVGLAVKTAYATIDK